jgi:Leucine-rich repeat (LRR) protein
MEHDLKTPTPPVLSNYPIGYLSNGGVQRYLLEAESSTGFVAFKTADGTTLVSNAMQVSIAASRSISFWPCAAYKDTTPDGQIISFDCHGNALTHLEVRALAGLEYLDCSFNQLAELPLDGLTELQGLAADNNQLNSLDVRRLDALRVLNCAGNRLRKLDLSGLDSLQILDCSNNQLVALKLDGCTTIQDLRTIGNPVDAPGSQRRG